mmetsp:Transcript_71835/g.160845  ORF Transcript_71835/g.160845 Transcript_71835/m.160845 type:complete len:222 (-) Transcript_71835:46-711(-)
MHSATLAPWVVRSIVASTSRFTMGCRTPHATMWAALRWPPRLSGRGRRSLRACPSKTCSSAGHLLASSRLPVASPGSKSRTLATWSPLTARQLRLSQSGPSFAAAVLPTWSPAKASLLLAGPSTHTWSTGFPSRLGGVCSSVASGRSAPSSPHATAWLSSLRLAPASGMELGKEAIRAREEVLDGACLRLMSTTLRVILPIPNEPRRAQATDQRFLGGHRR